MPVRQRIPIESRGTSYWVMSVDTVLLRKAGEGAIVAVICIAGLWLGETLI